MGLINQWTQSLVALAPYVILGLIVALVVIHSTPMDSMTREIISNIASGMIGAATGVASMKAMDNKKAPGAGE